MNHMINEASKAVALVVGTIVLLAGISAGIRPWALGFRVGAVILGVWSATYLMAYLTSRVVLEEALRQRQAHEEQRETVEIAHQEGAEATEVETRAA